MHITRGSRQTPADRFPIPCALYLAAEGLHEEGTILNLSLTHGHLESAAAVVPGMTLALFIVLPGISHAVVIEEALVTWVRGGECGLRFDGVRPEDMVSLDTYLRKSAATPRQGISPSYALAK